MFGLDSEKSLEHVKLWLLEVRNNVPKDAIVAIVGNKTDLMEDDE